jgi:hypothetical protein
VQNLPEQEEVLMEYWSNGMMEGWVGKKNAKIFIIANFAIVQYDIIKAFVIARNVTPQRAFR